MKTKPVETDRGGEVLDWAGLYDFQAGLIADPPAEFAGMFEPFPEGEAPHEALEARIRGVGVPGA